MSKVVFSAGDMERLERERDPRSDEIQAKIADICTEYNLPIVACLVPESNGFRGVMAGSKDLRTMLNGMVTMSEYMDAVAGKIAHQSGMVTHPDNEEVLH